MTAIRANLTESVRTSHRIFTRSRKDDTRAGIHASDNVIVGRDITSRDNSTDPNTAGIVSIARLTLEIYSRAATNTTRLLTSCNGPFRAYLRWNHPRRASFIESFGVIRLVNGEKRGKVKGPRVPRRGRG